MKNRSKLLWRCFGCGQPTATLHEIIPGNGNRQVCIDYHIQAPLCPVCHDLAHGKPHFSDTSILTGKKQRKIRALLLNRLDLDDSLTAQAVHDKEYRYYIEQTASKRLMYFKTMAI